MDIGDIVRLIFFAFIFLSFFGGLFGRKSGNEEEQPKRRPRPTDIHESGGEPAAPRPVSTTERTLQGMPERLRETFFPAPPEIHTGPRPQSRETATTAEASSGEQPRPEARRPAPPTDDIALTDVRRAERTLLERDLTDMPSPMDLDAENRPRRGESRQVMRMRRQRKTGGDVLRDSLRNPDTLERAFILKEVLDKPLALREQR